MPSIVISVIDYCCKIMPFMVVHQILVCILLVLTLTSFCIDFQNLEGRKRPRD